MNLSDLSTKARLLWASLIVLALVVLGLLAYTLFHFFRKPAPLVLTLPFQLEQDETILATGLQIMPLGRAGLLITSKNRAASFMVHKTTKDEYAFQVRVFPLIPWDNPALGAPEGLRILVPEETLGYAQEAPFEDNLRQIYPSKDAWMMRTLPVYIPTPRGLYAGFWSELKPTLDKTPPLSPLSLRVQNRAILFAPEALSVLLAP